MNEMTANFFREHLKAADDDVVSNHRILRGTRRRGDHFIVISDDDWYAIAETIYLNQVPGLLRPSRKRRKSPLSVAPNSQT